MDIHFAGTAAHVGSDGLWMAARRARQAHTAPTASPTKVPDSTTQATTGAQLPDPNNDPKMQFARNDLTEGSSGGPWLVDHEGQIAMSGINTMKPFDSDQQTWSPRFGASLEAMIAKALEDMMGV